MVIPIVTFASELLVLNDDDIQKIEAVQRYSGRRIQRVHSRSPNETSYVGLGWLRIEYYIYVKKLLFIRSVAVLVDSMIYKRVFIQRLLQYESYPVRGAINECTSPIFDMIRISEIFGVFTDVKGMLNGTKSYSKHHCKDEI